MTNDQFIHWLGGVLAATPFDSPAESRACALEIVRAQVVKQLVGDAAKQANPGLYPSHRAQVVSFYEQQEEHKRQIQRDMEKAQIQRALTPVSFGAIPSPADEARDTETLMIERGYQPQKGQ